MEEILRQALNDSHHRVVANALLGLYMLGDEKSLQVLREMTTHESA